MVKALHSGSRGLELESWFGLYNLLPHLSNPAQSGGLRVWDDRKQRRTVCNMSAHVKEPTAAKKKFVLAQLCRILGLFQADIDVDIDQTSGYYDF